MGGIKVYHFTGEQIIRLRDLLLDEEGLLLDCTRDEVVEKELEIVREMLKEINK